ATLLSKTMTFDRLIWTYNQFSTIDWKQNPTFYKFFVYEKIISGKVWEDANALIGSGPSSFTSRSSVMRIPEDRINSLPFPAPEFRSPVYKKHISPLIRNLFLKSYGNFSTPNTSIVSVTVELGLIGLSVFVGFFIYIYSNANKIEDTARKNFAKYLTFFFILSLFHINFWEYPVISLTYIFFISNVVSILPQTLVYQEVKIPNGA
ncbi:MAG: hypothetical protein JW795_06350, partial [Chitinivibrionales bacterium]|nr:hypothetical protein [Chitinivibrionales bacterium]